MSGRFPMAENVAALWKNLAEGRDCIAEAPQERWDWRPWLRRGADADGALRWGGFIDGVDEFDPLFFGISPKEAELMDPQQRLLMQEVWATLEDAGYAAGSLAKSATGVFIGIGGSGYAARTMHPGADIEGHSSTGVVPSAGPNRISYLLDLNGPSQAIETACSSSLVAVHRAVQSLMQGECTLALAGGVNLLLAPELSVSFDRAGMLSPNGRCKTFSDAADGYVRGEGVGMLLLKPLAAAERDGDRIYGVIRSTGENHGGRAQSLTAPNPNAQADLIAGVCQRAGIDPRSIGYVEAHGTGTPLGDPIEIAGLGNAFARLAEAKGVSLPQGYCGVGLHQEQHRPSGDGGRHRRSHQVPPADQAPAAGAEPALRAHQPLHRARRQPLLYRQGARRLAGTARCGRTRAAAPRRRLLLRLRRRQRPCHPRGVPAAAAGCRLMLRRCRRRSSFSPPATQSACASA